MPTMRYLAGFLLIIGFFPVQAVGQGIEDLFAELAADTVQSEEQLSLAAKLRDNLDGRFSAGARRFFRALGAGEGKNLTGDMGSYRARLEMDTWTGGARWRLALAGWLEYGSEDDMWAGYGSARELLRDGRGTESRRHYAELNEAYLRLDFQRLDVSVGKQILVNGVAPFYSPADRLGSFDLRDPTDLRRLGTWVARVDYYPQTGTAVTAALLPIYQPAGVPQGRSRWLANSIDFDFAAGGGAQAEIGEKVAALGIDQAAFFLRLKTAVAGVDLFASVYRGLNPLYVLRAEPSPTGFVVSKETVDVLSIAAGLAATHQSWEYHGEAVYSRADDRRDDTFFSYVVGASRGLDGLAVWAAVRDLRLFVDYAGEALVDKQAAAGYIASSRRTRWGRNDLVARFLLDASEDLDCTMTGGLSLAPRGHFAQCEVSYRVKADIVAVGTIKQFGGSKETYYGRWRRNDAAEMRLVYGF